MHNTLAFSQCVHLHCFNLKVNTGIFKKAFSFYKMERRDSGKMSNVINQWLFFLICIKFYFVFQILKVENFNTLGS